MTKRGEWSLRGTAHEVGTLNFYCQSLMSLNEESNGTSFHQKALVSIDDLEEKEKLFGVIYDVAEGGNKNRVTAASAASTEAATTPRFRAVCVSGPMSL